MIPARAGILAANRTWARLLTDPHWLSVVALFSLDSSLNDESPGGVYDLTSSGAAAFLDTSEKKFGAGSGKVTRVSATTDGFSIPAVADVPTNIAGGDWTLEAWVYLDIDAFGSGNYYGIMGKRSNGSRYWIVYVDLAGKIVFANNTTSLVSTVSIPIRAWTHVAIVRYGATVTIYLGGIGVGSAVLDATNSTGIAGTRFSIGNTMAINTAGLSWKGWIDEVRVTKGVARYTADFTPPAAPFPRG